MWNRALILFFVSSVLSLDMKALREELMADENFRNSREECLKEQSLTEDDLKIDIKPDDIPENILCFIKCVQHKQGYIDDEGTINIDKVKEAPIFSYLDEAKIKEITECVEEVGKIETCQDVAKMKDCVHRYM